MGSGTDLISRPVRKEFGQKIGDDITIATGAATRYKARKQGDLLGSFGLNLDLFSLRDITNCCIPKIIKLLVAELLGSFSAN